MVLKKPNVLCLATIFFVLFIFEGEFGSLHFNAI